MRRLILIGGLLATAAPAADAQQANVALGLARRPAVLALRDPGWFAKRALGRALLAGPPDPSAGAWPLSPAFPYGPIYRLPLYGRMTQEGGALSIRAAPGSPAFAPATGRIAYAGPFRAYGDVLILDHGHGWTTVLTGLADLGVTQGGQVQGGDAIGRAGPVVRVQLLHHGRGTDIRAIAARLGG